MENIYNKIDNTMIGCEVKDSFDNETWTKLSLDENAAYFANDAVFDNISEIKYDGTVEAKFGVASKYYIAIYHGGKNGNGKWSEYLYDIDKLLKGLGDAWIIDLNYDCLDDVYDLTVGFNYINNHKRNKFFVGDAVTYDNLLEDIMGTVKFAAYDDDNDKWVYEVVFGSNAFTLRCDESKLNKVMLGDCDKEPDYGQEEPSCYEDENNDPAYPVKEANDETEEQEIVKLRNAIDDVIIAYSDLVTKSINEKFEDIKHYLNTTYAEAVDKRIKDEVKTQMSQV